MESFVQALVAFQFGRREGKLFGQELVAEQFGDSRSVIFEVVGRRIHNRCERLIGSFQFREDRERRVAQFRVASGCSHYELQEHGSQTLALNELDALQRKFAHVWRRLTGAVGKVWQISEALL